MEHSGHAGALRQINCLGACRNRRSIGRDITNTVTLHNHNGICPKLSLAIPELSKAHGLDDLDRLGVRPLLRANSSHTCSTENRRQQNPHRRHGTPTPSSHTYTLNDACFLIQLSMECNREELVTADGGAAEWVLCFARRKRSREAWAEQRPRSGSQDPIAEAFSHQACQSDSAHVLLGIFWSLQSS